MDKVELVQLIGYLRRLFPRHMQVLMLCQETERLVAENASLHRLAQEKNKKFDRNSYQREYMRRYRKRAGG